MKQIAKKQSDDEKVLAMLAHLLSLFTWFIGPLIIFLIKRDTKSLAYENAKHALNFQISLFIYYIIAFALIIILIGFLLIFILWIFALVAVIIGCIRAYEGNVYKYPLEIPFIR